MEKRITNLERGLDKKMQRKISSEGEIDVKNVVSNCMVMLTFTMI